MTRAALYVRVSTSAQAEKFSLPAQRRILTEYAAGQGWDSAIYEDAGISGETIDDRPAMTRLLEDARARKFGVVVAVEMERFSRSTDLYDILRLKKTFREAGIRWGTPNQTFSPGDPEDDFLSVLFGALSAREKSKFIKRSRLGKDQAARQGRYLGPRAPFGYAKQGGALVVDPGEAAVVRRIHEMWRRGNTARAIAAALTAGGIPTPRRARAQPGAGDAWAKSTVLFIIHSTAYAGRSEWGRTRSVSGARVRQEGGVITVAIPAIVTDAALEEARSRRPPRRKSRHPFLLGGIVKCACGRPMHGGLGGSGLRYYRRSTCRCGGTARASELERLAWAQVVRIFRTPGAVLSQIRRSGAADMVARPTEWAALYRFGRRLGRLTDDERSRVLRGVRRAGDCGPWRPGDGVRARAYRARTRTC